MKNLIGTIICMILMHCSYAQEGDFTLSKSQIESEILEVSGVLHSEAILDSLVTRVLSNSNLIKAIDQEMVMYDEEIKQNKRSWISSFRLGVNVFSANTTLDANNESYTTYGLLPNVGLNLSIDPAKLVNRKSYVRQSESKREYSRYIQEDAKTKLKKDILNLYYDYLGLLESVNIRHQAYTTRQQQQEFLDESFRAGNASYTEALIAENQVHLAKEALVKASIDAMKRRSEISVLLGLK